MTRARLGAGAVLAAVALGAAGLSACIPVQPVTAIYTYSVATDGAITTNVDEFRAEAARVFNDHRGWRAAGITFQEVASGGDFTLVLANAASVPAYDPICSADYSCQAGRFVVVNDTRYRLGSPNWPGPVDWYRVMVLNHELGHWLGLGHQLCGGPGEWAPVMQQQSIDMQGCEINPWPHQWEIDTVRAGR